MDAPFGKIKNVLNLQSHEMFRTVGSVYEIIAQQNKLVYYREIWHGICIQWSLSYTKSGRDITHLDDPDIHTVAQMSDDVYNAFTKARKRFYLKHFCQPKDYVSFPYTPKECQVILEKRFRGMDNKSLDEWIKKSYEFKTKRTQCEFLIKQIEQMASKISKQNDFFNRIPYDERMPAQESIISFYNGKINILKNILREFYKKINKHTYDSTWYKNFEEKPYIYSIETEIDMINEMYAELYEAYAEIVELEREIDLNDNIFIQLEYICNNRPDALKSLANSGFMQKNA